MDIDPSVHLVKPGMKLRLNDRDPADRGGLTIGKSEARDRLKDLRRRMTDLQEKLYAEGERSLLVVLQAMDTGGKDSTIRAVTQGINPQGTWVRSFKAPSKNELARDYLWRVHKQVPPRGTIGIFNRSHYEDVLIVRVHGWVDEETIVQRYSEINDFERLLTNSGTRIVKIMLHISKEYQLGRLRRRLERPDKHWKFNPGDLRERALWYDYQDAYERALTNTSTKHAPWYVIPAETRWYRNLVVAQTIVNALESMNPAFPAPDFDPADYPPDSLV
ncbi:MAG: polyphosphate kinase 2 family protein [Rhodothermales bacterium]|nr:polyphosphate kinase 2 family protein [Rhodothermales bacterium]